MGLVGRQTSILQSSVAALTVDKYQNTTFVVRNAITQLHQASVGLSVEVVGTCKDALEYQLR